MRTCSFERLRNKEKDEGPFGCHRDRLCNFGVVSASRVDESPSRTRPHPVREAGERLSRWLRPRASSHRLPTWIQLLRGAGCPSAHTGRAHFPHDIHGPNYIRVLCLDGPTDHLSSGKGRLSVCAVFFLRSVNLLIFLLLNSVSIHLG